MIIRSYHPSIIISLASANVCFARLANGESQKYIVTSLKMLQSDWLMKCTDIVIMTLRGAKTIFLDTWYATMEKT